jgi:hypothetical protein
MPLIEDRSRPGPGRVLIGTAPSSERNGSVSLRGAVAEDRCQASASGITA